MDEYTPSIEEVRKQYAFAMAGDRIHRTEQYMAEFDRMLAEHDRALSEKAWDEGWIVGWGNPPLAPILGNPYRITEENN